MVERYRAGRGWSARLSAGVRLEAGPVTAILAPQLLHSRNRGLQTFPSPAAERSDHASPWYSGERLMDLPLRVGNAPLPQLDPGQSSLTLRLGGAAVGAATKNQWWGPGSGTRWY